LLGVDLSCLDLSFASDHSLATAWKNVDLNSSLISLTCMAHGQCLPIWDYNTHLKVVLKSMKLGKSCDLP
jgi:hypothetical protein